MALSRFVLPYADVGAGIRPSSGAKLFFYASGTSTFKSTFTDATGSTANTNPVIANANGVFPAIFLEGVFNVALKDANDVQIWTEDPYSTSLFTSPVFSTVAAMVASTPTALDGVNVIFTVGMFVSLVDYATGNNSGVLFGSIVANGTGTADGGSYIDLANGMQWKQNFPSVITVKMFGAKGDKVTNDAAKIQAAINFSVANMGNSSSFWGADGAGIFFPSGAYLIDTKITIADNAITLYGDPSKGPELLCTNDSLTMFEVGDTTLAENKGDVRFVGLTLRCESDTTTTIALAFYNSIRVQIENCIFLGFYQTILASRLAQSRILNCEFKIDGGLRTVNPADSFIRLMGNSTGTGGGLHIADCELIGSSSNQMLNSGIYIEEVDSIYIVNTHFDQMLKCIHVAPTGAEGKNKITDIFSSNCYFDSGINLNQSIYLEGSVDSGGLYQNIKFDGCLFRGAFHPANLILISVADAGSFYSSGLRLENISFDNCTFRQSTDSAVKVLGSSASKLEVVGLNISDSFFEENYQSGSSGVTDIIIEVESATITGNTFDASSTSATYSVQLLMGTSPDVPSALCSNNDFSNSTYTSRAVNYSDVSGSNISITHNVYRGVGQYFNEVFKLSTTNASLYSVLNELIPQSASGFLKVVINGSSADASEYANYIYEGSYRRASGGSFEWSGSDPVLTKSFKTSGVLTAPVLTNSSNDLVVNITGIASTTMTWVVHVERVQSK
jgi:hypothetical protein